MEQQDFNINIFALKIGNHEFDYTINGDFLQVFNPDLTEQANLTTHIELRKSETMIETHFQIQGTVVLTCDRSLEEYQEELDIQKRMFFKFGENAEVMSDEIEIIPFHQHDIDVSHLIYEFIAVSIPMKKVHPDLRDEALEEEEGLSEELVYSSTSQTEEETEQTEDSEEDNDSGSIDPRWEALKHISKN